MCIRDRPTVGQTATYSTHEVNNPLKEPIALFAHRDPLATRDRGVTVNDGAFGLGRPDVQGETRKCGVGRPDAGHSLLWR